MIERFVHTPELRLRVLTFGEPDAPPVVVLPGIASPAGSWAFFGEALAATHCVHVPDLRGRGGSDQSPSGYGIADYERDLDGLLDGLGLERPLLVGHSLGARIVAAHAAHRPGAASAVVLIDPPLSGPRRPYPTRLETFLAAIRAAREGRATIADARAEFPRWEERLLAARIEWLGTCSEAAVAETHAGFHADDFLDWWPRLAAPAVLVRGAESDVVTDADLDVLRDANPLAEIVTIPAAGHMVAHDAPEPVVRVVRATAARAAEMDTNATWRG